MSSVSPLLAKILQKFCDAELFATDFDGVHTDGFAYMDQHGIETVRVSRRDGLAYNMLQKAGIECRILSKETNPVVAARAKKLGVLWENAISSGEGKREILERLAQRLGIAQEAVLYIGDDINDLPALEWAGMPVCPADAHQSVKDLVVARDGYIATRKGGDSVIREVVELLLSARGLPLAF